METGKILEFRQEQIGKALKDLPPESCILRDALLLLKQYQPSAGSADFQVSLIFLEKWINRSVGDLPQDSRKTIERLIRIMKNEAASRQDAFSQPLFLESPGEGRSSLPWRLKVEQNQQEEAFSGEEDRAPVCHLEVEHPDLGVLNTRLSYRPAETRCDFFISRRAAGKVIRRYLGAFRKTLMAKGFPLVHFRVGLLTGTKGPLDRDAGRGIHFWG